MPNRTRKPRHWWALWFLLPGTVLFLGFVLLPIVLAGVLSFTFWNGSGAIHWAGLANWKALFHDSDSFDALKRTFIVVLGCLLIQEPISLMIGVFAAGKQGYRKLFTAIFFLPLLVSAAAVGVLWSNLLSPVGGGIQYAAQHWGLFFLNKSWLGDPSLALYTVIVLISWEFMPFHTLLYTAAVQQIPRTLYEAAAIDGVGPWQRHWHITLPMLRNTIITSSTLNIIGSFTAFDLIFTLTSGGPGESTRVLALQQYYVGFTQFQFGYASVLAIVLGAIAMLIAVAIIAVTRLGNMQSVTEGGG